MPSVKISELVQSSNLNVNPSDSYFVTVDSETSTTTKISAKSVGDTLYANNALFVGSGGVSLTNVIAQFTGVDGSFVQMSMQNQNATGSADYVVTADTGTNANAYIDLGINNSQFADPIFSAMKPFDGYLYVRGPTDTGATGNLVMGTASEDANIVFIASGTLATNAVGYISKNGTLWNSPFTANGGLYFQDGTLQRSAANTNGLNPYVTSAYDTANAAITQIASNTLYQFGINASQNTLITTAAANTVAINTFSYSAFAKANSALANSTGIFAGDLTITGNTFAQAMNTTNFQVIGAANVSGTLDVVGAVAMNATLVIANSNFATTEAAFRITAAGSSQTPTQAGTLMQLTSRAHTPARVLIDSFGTSNTAYPIIAGRAARGTVVSPTATQNNDILLRIAGNSYGDTGYAPFGDARIDFVSTENHSDTARGSRIRFWNTPNGSNVVNEIASFNADSVTFTGVVNPTKGFIFTPRLPIGNQTTITIDFTNDVIIKANLAADLTVTLSNFVFGKVVEVWLTNTSGLTRTITHGCSSINSSENATTFTMPSTSSAYLRYFSIDGDLANTFVAIQSA
jgi:hypothetical protein